MSSLEKPYVSEVLGAETIEAAIRGVPGVLRGLLGDDAIVIAMYGYGSGLHPDICFMPMRVGLKWIDRFLSDSLRQGIILPADSDFYITIPEDRLEIEFCHEGDIHFGGTDAELLKLLLKLEPYSCLQGAAGKQSDA